MSFNDNDSGFIFLIVLVLVLAAWLCGDDNDGGHSKREKAAQ